MANPVLIKAAVMLLTDKRTWKAIGVVIAAVLTPCYSYHHHGGRHALWNSQP